MQERVNYLNDSVEFRELESNYSGKFSHVSQSISRYSKSTFYAKLRQTLASGHMESVWITGKRSCQSTFQVRILLLDVPDPFPSFCSTSPLSTPNWNQETPPVPLRQEDCCLAIRLNQLLAHLKWPQGHTGFPKNPPKTGPPVLSCFFFLSVPQVVAKHCLKMRGNFAKKKTCISVTCSFPEARSKVSKNTCFQQHAFSVDSLSDLKFLFF